MAELGQTLRRNATLADAHFHWIARHEAYRYKGREHQRDKSRYRQKNAANEIREHGKFDSADRL